MAAVSVCGGRLLLRGLRCVLNNKSIISQLQQNTPSIPLAAAAFPVRNLASETHKWGEVKNPEEVKHFRFKEEAKDLVANERSASLQGDNGSWGAPPIASVVLPHPIWSEKEVNDVAITHIQPERFVDKLALWTVRALRSTFDAVSGFNRKERDERMWVSRIAFLETVAAVPGMVAAMVRHLHSLRRMRRDHGWIHTLLEEAENERMHLMTALALKQPTWMFRTAVLVTQGVIVTFWGLSYLVSARYCHRFVGYLEEEAVITYTKCLQDIDSDGPMQKWSTLLAPPVAARYWQLPEGATMRDVILAIRADEAHHRIVNHTFASMRTDDYNPYKDLGSHYSN